MVIPIFSSALALRNFINDLDPSYHLYRNGSGVFQRVSMFFWSAR